MSAPVTYRLALSAGRDFRVGSEMLERRRKAANEEERQRELRELRDSMPSEKRKAA